jgi:8-oxo-dGTP pyrophosphatase MutT (NUDIX family)
VPHIHTEPGQHDVTVGAFIVRLDTKEPTIMLHRHKKLKQYLHFGGHVELNENPWQALTHELLEESGYDISQLKLLQPKVRIKKLPAVTLHPIPICILTHKFDDIDHFHTDITYAFTTRETPRHNSYDGESKDFRLFTAKELESLPASEIPENIRETCLFILEEFMHSAEAIPAAIV